MSTRVHLCFPSTITLLTDDSGSVMQALAYMPYSEDWVDDSKILYSDTTKIGVYQFNIAEVESRASLLALPRCSNVCEDNGKERDYESGFLYYGARYHWSELWTTTAVLQTVPMPGERNVEHPASSFLFNQYLCNRKKLNKHNQYL